jgi:hypothetical protein
MNAKCLTLIGTGLLSVSVLMMLPAQSASGAAAQTGKPIDAATHTVAPPVKNRSEAFGFIVPADAIPGSSIAIQASVTDTKGQVVNAAVNKSHYSVCDTSYQSAVQAFGQKVDLQ